MKMAFWLLVVLFVAEFPRPAVLAMVKAQLLIIGILTIVHLAMRRTKLRSPQLTAGFLLLSLISASVLYAYNYYSAYMAARGVFGYFIIMLTLAWVSRDTQFRTKLIDILVVLLSYCSIYAVLHNGMGPGGFMGDENDMALGGNVCLALSLFGYVYSRGMKRWFYAAGAALAISGVVASLSRGGFISFVAVVGFFLITQPGLIKKAALLAVAATLFLTFAPGEYLEEVATIGAEAQSTNDDDSTASHRYYLWATGLNMFLDNPIFGVGAQNFPIRAGQYQPMTGDWPPSLFERSVEGTVSHSTYVDIVAELGLTGTTLWIFMVGSTLLGLRRFRKDAAKRRDDPEARLDQFHSLGLMGAMIAFLGSALTISVPYYPYPWYLIGLSVGLLAARPQPASAERPSPDRAFERGPRASARPAPRRIGGARRSYK